MILSMTAFARKVGEAEKGSLVWEMRGVNHRYLELSFKLPEAWRFLETDLRKNIKANIYRGKIDITLKWLPKAEETNSLHFNEGRFEQLCRIAKKVSAFSAEVTPFSMGEILTMPGVLIEKISELDESSVNDQNMTHEKGVLRESFALLVKEFLITRQREGLELHKNLHERVHKLIDHTQIIVEQMPVLVEAQQLRLLEQIKQIETKIDESRWEQELVYLAQRADVSEELDRLMVHLHALRDDLNLGGVLGRRLDFLLQEVNREVNTFCAKSISGDVSQRGVEMKVLVEQMREQVQNIE